MTINALLLDEKDNVVTCVKEVRAGEAVVYRAEEGIKTLTAMEDIPYCHKVALVDLQAGDKAIKYGEMIGEVSHPVAKGGWVNENNIFSDTRDYDSELV